MGIHSVQVTTAATTAFYCLLGALHVSGTAQSIILSLSRVPAERKEMTRKSVNTNRLIGVVNFDGLAEGTFIEPTIENSFNYLQTLRYAS